MDPPIRMKDHISHLKRKRSKNKFVEENSLSEMNMIPNHDSKSTFAANDLDVHDESVYLNKNLSSTTTSNTITNKQSGSSHKSKSKDHNNFSHHHRNHHHSHHHHHSNHVQPNNSNLYYNNLKRENSSYSQSFDGGSNEILTIKSDVVSLKHSLHFVIIYVI